MEQLAGRRLLIRQAIASVAAVGLAAPSGIVTLLFTDIEGSTRAWEQGPADMALALARHDALITAEVEDAGGYVFKTVGDAFCAVFAEAGAGVLAAAAAQRVLAAEAWPATPIRVRMALHSGVCEERANDYFGPTVNRVARLLAIGHGGQTLISGSTAVLLTDGLPDGMVLRDLGVHRLKDLARAERVFQLDGDGLPTSFPPLKSLDEVPRHNLPEQLTSFVGREREMEQVTNLIASSRLVTLTGPGGIGKTRIAVEAAIEQRGAWRDGVWVVELAPVAQPESVAVQVGAVLQVREQTGRVWLDTLVEALADRQVLMVLDNCEHVIDGVAELVEHLSRSCPQVSIVATSREPLGVRGERVFRVPSLVLPAADTTASERLAETDAVRLFMDRAAQHDARLALDSSNLAMVARVCRRLDGIPLAIELAAARLRSMSLADLEHGLDQRFRLLAGGPRSWRERHKTMRATVDWSYELLTPDEQACFAELSVFSGGFDLDAADAVCGVHIDRWDVLDLLTALVDKSVLRADHDLATTRFALLETMRDYAGDRLAEQGTESLARVRRAHRDHYLALIEGLARAFDGGDGASAMDRLQLDYGNLRATLLMSLDDPDPEPGLRLVVALRHLWLMRGPVLESTDIVVAMLAHPEAAARTMLRANALLVAGSLQRSLARIDDATASLEEALAIADERDDPLVASQALTDLSFIAYLEHDIGRALELSERALHLARRSGDRVAMAQAIMRRADAFDVAGDRVRCIELMEEAVTILRPTGNQRLLGAALFNASEAVTDFHDLSAARRYLEEAFSVAQTGGNTTLLTYIHIGLGTVLALDREPDEARVHLDAGLRGADAIGAPLLVANAMLMKAVAASLSGDPIKSCTLHGAADAIVEDCGVPFEPLQCRLRDDDRARLRASIGETAFDTEYQRGRLLTRTGAISLALGPPPVALSSIHNDASPT